MGSRAILFLFATAAACTVSQRDDDGLTARQREQLAELGIAAVAGERPMFLFAETGDEVGRLTHEGPTVQIELGATSVRLQRGGAGLQVQCSAMAHDVVLADPSELLAAEAIDTVCRRPLAIAAIITEIDRAHASGCVTVEVDGERRLDCADAELADDDETFRLLSSGQDCGCAADWSGYCPAECWSCGQFCDPWGSGGWEPWGGGGGGGGDPEPEPLACTPYGQDCTVARPCCGTNVCAYGGEREEPWCHPLDAGEWTGSCVVSRSGATVSKDGNYCRTSNGQEMPSRCWEVQGTRCVIGHHGDCGDGDYTMRIRDLAQIPSDTCLI